MRIIRRDDRGEDVRDVQHRLIALGFPIEASELEGAFGTSTVAAVRAFQEGRRLPVDGLVGPDTWGQLVEAGYRVGDRTLYLRYPFLRGDDVRELQRRLNALGFDAGKEDGILGRESDRAIRDFQRNVGQEIDGIVGPDTVAAMSRLRPDETATSRAVVREAEAVRRLRTPVEGAVVAIDAGGGPDAGAGAGPSGLPATTALLDLSKELAAELRIRGAVPVLLGGDPDSAKSVSPSERAAAANQCGAALCVSFEVHGEGGSGCSAAFFGTGTTYSPMGERLAELIVGRISDASGLASLGTRRLAVSMLRETRMPAVVVEPARISDHKDEARLRDPGFRRDVAAAVADAIASFLRADAPT